MGLNKKKFHIKNCGYDKPVFSIYRNDLVEQNKRNVESTSFIGAIIMIILFISSLFVSSVSKVKPLYITTAVVFSIIYCLSKTYVNKNRKWSILLNYLFILTAFFFALGLDIIQKNPTATTVCVLLVSLPLLIQDKPYRVFTFFFIMSIAFSIESIWIKQSPKASIDVLNSFSFLLIGDYLGYKYTGMVLRNIVNHHLLKEQRDTDSLTQLYTKSAFEENVKKCFQKGLQKGSMFVIDMDNFKFINDNYGHHAGDEILTQIGNALSSIKRDTDYVGRFGGDEFVLVFPGIDNKDILIQKAEAILEKVKDIHLSMDETYKVHISIGIASFPNNATDYDSLFKAADNAMYNIKKFGKNGYSFYEDSGKIKVLVVDDIDINRAFICKALQDSYLIIEAENGEDALEKLNQNKDISLIITDLQMPKMDGITLIQNIRSNSLYDSIGIIANTQQGDIELESKVAAMGCDDFIYKAASIVVIQMRVKNLLKAREKMS